MAKSLYELEQEMKELQRQLALVPPAYTAGTFTRRDYLIARRRELEWQISQLQPLLDEARENNELLLRKTSIATPSIESEETQTDKVEMNDLAENLEENTEEE